MCDYTCSSISCISSVFFFNYPGIHIWKSANRHKTYKAFSSTVIQQLFSCSTHSSHHGTLSQQRTMVLCSATPPTDTFNLFEMALFITGHLGHGAGKSLPSSRLTFEPNKIFYNPLSHLKMSQRRVMRRLVKFNLYTSANVVYFEWDAHMTPALGVL